MKIMKHGGVNVVVFSALHQITPKFRLLKKKLFGFPFFFKWVKLPM